MPFHPSLWWRQRPPELDFYGKFPLHSRFISYYALNSYYDVLHHPKHIQSKAEYFFHLTLVCLWQEKAILWEWMDSFNLWSTLQFCLQCWQHSRLTLYPVSGCFYFSESSSHWGKFLCYSFMYRILRILERRKEQFYISTPWPPDGTFARDDLTRTVETGSRARTVDRGSGYWWRGRAAVFPPPTALAWRPQLSVMLSDQFCF